MENLNTNNMKVNEQHLEEAQHRLKDIPLPNVIMQHDIQQMPKAPDVGPESSSVDTIKNDPVDEAEKALIKSLRSGVQNHSLTESSLENLKKLVHYLTNDRHASSILDRPLLVTAIKDTTEKVYEKCYNKKVPAHLSSKKIPKRM